MKKHHAKVSKRINYIFIAIFVMFVVLVIRFAWLQLVQGAKYTEDVMERAASSQIHQSPRGKILDRNGRELAISRVAKTLSINPSMIKEEEKEPFIAAAAEILAMKPEEIRDAVESGGYFAFVKHCLEPEEEAAIRKLRSDHDYTFVQLDDEVKRYYPNDELAANVLGFVGTEDRGLAGIELSQNDLIKGDVVKDDKITDTQGRPIFMAKFFDNVDHYQGTDCKNVTLTIDSNIQFMVEQSLDKAMVENKPKNVIAIVMDPRNGDVLAMASRPSYNPNKFWKGNDELWRNRAVSFNYEPGSTFKAMVAAAALEEGVVTPNQTFYDTGHIDVSEKRIQNWNGEGFGNVTFVDIVKNSINTCFAQIGLWLGGDKLNEYAHRFGFGEPTGIGFSGEESGVLFDGKMLNSDEATMAIGQSIAVTPLQLITAMSAIANDGVLLKPHIIKNITNADGSMYKEYGREEVRRVISSETDKTLMGLLEQVVATGGGSKAGVTGYRVAGKTGTAQKINENGVGYMNGRYIASFCGFAPVENPELVVLVIIDDPSAGQFYGGQIAAPVARDIFTQLFRFLHISPSSDAFADMDTNNKKAKNQSPSANKQAPAGKVLVPNVQGKSIRDVSQELATLGLGIDVQGSGLATGQNVAPGTAVDPGNSITVYFNP